MIGSLLVAVGWGMVAGGLVSLALGPLLRRRDRGSFAETIQHRWDLDLPTVHHRRVPHDWQARGEL
jgi:hypothetical protein